ncbi:PREDICTED: tetraspanin-11-like [Nanorana parkeri]|uniref:tetraspanin-11-like n=1 Tax=Nanorana parkeri TaxID=125878 RepID=UPI000854BBB5|nr:PREDICTED: tetraspanin-11-like [Nanorana parkeri]
MGHAQDEEKDERGSICLKYLLFLFNFFFWIGGAAAIAMGLWTLLEKSSYISFLAYSTLSISAYILLFAGGVVMLTGFFGCCAVIREKKACLLFYLVILISVYAAELAAGVLAYIYYETISEELKDSLNETIINNYAQPGMNDVTYAIDHLQQDFRCCGSSSYEDWRYSLYAITANNSGNIVPDSCCKTMTAECGRRDHPSNIYRVEGGCMSKLETFIQEHLLLIGAISIGIACFQLIGVTMSACFLRILYKEEKEELYNMI